MKFMCCMNLSTATLAIGIIKIILALLVVYYGNYLSIYSIIFGIACCVVYAKPHSLTLRKVIVIMFWIEIAFFIGSLIFDIIMIASGSGNFDCSKMDD